MKQHWTRYAKHHDVKCLSDNQTLTVPNQDRCGCQKLESTLQVVLEKLNNTIFDQDQLAAAQEEFNKQVNGKISDINAVQGEF
jgi:hypothetical protein